MVDAAVDRGIADPGRLGIGGWSYGGFLTAWGVGKTKKRFRAGIVGAGIVDWSGLAADSIFPDVLVSKAMYECCTSSNTIGYTRVKLLERRLGIPKKIAKRSREIQFGMSTTSKLLCSSCMGRAM